MWDSNPWKLHLKFLCKSFFFCVVDSLCVCMQFKRVYIFCYHIRSSISNLGQKIQNFNRLISSNSNLNHFSNFWQNFEYCINLNVLSHWQYFCFMMKLYFVTGKSKTGPILDFLVATLHWKEIKPLFSFIVRKKSESYLVNGTSHIWIPIYKIGVWLNSHWQISPQMKSPTKFSVITMEFKSINKGSNALSS